MAIKYSELKEGELFRLNPRNDKRVFRRDKEGSTQVVDADGLKIVNPTFKAYPYMDMPVYRKI